MTKPDWQYEVVPLVAHVVRFAGAIAIVCAKGGNPQEGASTTANRLWKETADR